MVLLLCLTSLLISLRAQEQDRKLADRLLRPDMSLVNPAQAKKFSSVGGASIDKKFATKSFSTSETSLTKNFSDSKKASTPAFRTRNFDRAATAANVSAHAQSADANKKFATKESSLVRTSSQSAMTDQVQDYPDNRPFRGKGTRQEILRQEDKPLTIDEVRELLNKSK